MLSTPDLQPVAAAKPEASEGTAFPWGTCVGSKKTTRNEALLNKSWVPETMQPSVWVG